MKGRIAAGNLHLHGHHFYNRYVPPPPKNCPFPFGILTLIYIKCFFCGFYYFQILYFPLFFSQFTVRCTIWFYFERTRTVSGQTLITLFGFFYLIYWNWSSLRAVLHWRWGLLVWSEWTRSAGSYCCGQSTNIMNFVTWVQRSKVAHLTRPKIDQAAYIDVGKKSAHAVQERFTS